MSAVGVLLNSSGKKIVTDLQKSMSDKRLNASGDTSRSISYQVEETLTKAILKIMANRSIGALQFGRKAGRMPPRDVIRQWIDSKPISLTGGMTKDQLNRFNPGGVISDVVNDELIDKIFKEVKLASINRLVEATRKLKGGFAK